MKAYEIRAPFGIESLEQVERPIPQIGRGQVLIRLRAVSLNYRDIMVINGTWAPKENRIPVSDGAGEVVEVGSEVRRFKPGDRVATVFLPGWISGELTETKLRPTLGGISLDGVLSEFAVLDEDSLISVPDFLSFEEASTLPCAGLTAWNAVSRVPVKKDDVVLVQGTGGVSLFAMQFLLLKGAKVLITSKSDEKLSRAKEMGAFETINYSAFPDWDQRALEMTSNRGVDLILETVGGENLNRSFNAIRMSGAISMVGLLKGTSGNVETFNIALKNCVIHGIEVGSREMFNEMNNTISEHNLKPVVDKVFSFDQAREAFQYLESGAHFGKVCIKISD